MKYQNSLKPVSTLYCSCEGLCRAGARAIEYLKYTPLLRAVGSLSFISRSDCANRLLKQLVVLLLPFLALTAAAHAEIKIGVVDMNRIFTEYNKTKKAQADYLVIEQATNKELESRVALLKAEVEKINQLDAALEKTELSGAALLAKKKEREEEVAKAKKMDDETADFRATKQKKFQDEFLATRKGIIDEIMKVVDEQTKIRGFDIVLDKSGLSAGALPVVIYTRPEFDISSDIISILNKKSL